MPRIYACVCRRCKSAIICRGAVCRWCSTGQLTTAICDGIGVVLPRCIQVAWIGKAVGHVLCICGGKRARRVNILLRFATLRIVIAHKCLARYFARIRRQTNWVINRRVCITDCRCTCLLSRSNDGTPHIAI